MSISLMIFCITDILWPNVVLPTMSVRLIVNLLTAILPNVCSPNQPLTKRVFIPNLN